MPSCFLTNNGVMMNYSEVLYKNVSDITNNNPNFEKKTVVSKGATYEIFNYRMVATYTNWLQDGARECRGLMYRVDLDSPVLVSHPFEKFFNYGENPIVLDVDLTNANRICFKEDGTMLSTYIKPDGTLGLKTKKTLDSVFVRKATEYLEKDTLFWMDLWSITKEGYTVIMEWISPNNRIVIPYQKDNLVVLAVRSNEDGSYATMDELQEFRSIHPRLMRDVLDSVKSDLTGFINGIRDLEDIEGFVFYLPDGEKIKYKTDWYVARHNLIDGLYSPRTLYKSIVDGTIDDAKSLLSDDPAKLDIINTMERRIEREFHKIVTSVEMFYNMNKDLERKDYAIKANARKDGLLPLYMNKYLGVEIDWKGWMIRKVRNYINSDGEWIGDVV